jgi:beta-lactamase regulating signal transducer with metallopeptidase domain
MLAAALEGIAPALAAALFHSLWQDALLGAAALLTLRAMTRARAALRHNVAMVFLLTTVLAPAEHFLRLLLSDAPIDDGLLRALALPFAFIGENDGFPAATSVVLIWIVGVSLMLARHAAGLGVIAAMERGAYQPLPAVWSRRVDDFRRALGIVCDVAVRLSDDVLAPCTARLLRPVIWLPLSMLTRTPAAQLEALLAHELAHIARKDWLWNGVQRVIECLLFFHPVVWWLNRRIRQEREHACDDLAVAACGDPVALAEALAALELGRQSAPRVSLAASGGSLLQRVSRLLANPQRKRGGVLALFGAVMISGALLFAQIAAAGARAPDLLYEASTAGELGPGDYRQITANSKGKQRVYRASIDAYGRLTEMYWEDGQVRPIDAGVRSWLGEVAREGASLSPPPPESLGDPAD